MPRQIILPPAAARDRYHRANISTGIRLDFWSIPVLSVAVFYLPSWFSFSAVAVLVLLSAFGAVMFAHKRKRSVDKRSRLPAVAAYPVGLQLCTIPFSSTEQRDAEFFATSIASNMTPGVFFPRNIVLDCVVAEIVFSYKVESIVVLRICKDTENQTLPLSENESSKRLIDVFPRVSLTYMECLALRSQINEYLRDS
jgi:hypothetical protein